jgi:hypothetical protein
VSKWTRTPPIRSKNNKNKWSEWLGQGKGEGDKGLMIFVLVGGTNRDLRSPFCHGLWLQSGPMGRGDIGPRLDAPTRTKGWPLVPICASNWDNMPLSPPRSASRWTRDKSPLWSRTQRQPGQMARIKVQFCSSVRDVLTPDFDKSDVIWIMK